MIRSLVSRIFQLRFAVAVSPAEASPWGFRAGFAILGFANGGELVIVQLLLSPRVGGERKGIVNGVIDSCGTLARIMTPPLTAALYKSGMAWTWSGFLPGLALVSLFFSVENDAAHPGLVMTPESSVDTTDRHCGTPEVELGKAPLCSRS